jgi:SNF2 family DNA or RNA helicase
MATVKATIIEDRIMVRAPFDYKERVKRVLGARWAKTEKAWSYPATVDTCLGLRREFGDELRVLPALAEWYEAASVRAADQAALVGATDATLVHVPGRAPRLAATLRPDQRVGARAIAEAYHGSILVADKPGLGKTLETIAGVLEAELPGDYLVVCPKLSVKNVWHREISKWTDEPVYMCRGTRAQRERALAAFKADPRTGKWLIIVSEMLRIRETPDLSSPNEKKMKFLGYEYPELFENDWGAVVVDESHKVMGSLTVVKGNLMGKGLKRLPVAPTGRRIAVSGTPFGKGGRVQGMFGTLHWLWPTEFTSFWRWAGTYFEIEEKVIDYRGKTAKKVLGLKGGLEGDDFLRTLGPRILRRTKEEVLPWLPPKQYVEVLCEMTPAQRRQYVSMTEDAEIIGENGVLLVNGTLALYTRAKQSANGVIDIIEGETEEDDDEVVFTTESCKVDALFEKMETRGILDGTGDTKIIIASQFNQFLDGCVKPRLEAAGVEYVEITGSTSDTKRDAAMDVFQGEGGPRVFVLNSKAGGVSITLDAADEVHCLDEMWSPEDNEQLEDRAHRASRNHQVTIFYYRTEGTVDEHIAQDVEGKRFEQHKVLDGRRGIEYARQMVTYRPTKEIAA